MTVSHPEPARRDPPWLDEAAAMWMDGKGTHDIARRFSIAESSVYSWISEIKNIAKGRRR